MANVRNSNTFYVDTQYAAASDELAIRNIRVVKVIMVATAASAIAVLKDSSIANKLEMRIATSGDSQIFDFTDSPLVFSTSIRPVTLTNARLSIVIDETRG